MIRHGGRILVDQLAINGVDRVFQVPGESFLAALDGLYDAGIDVVTCRQEGGAAMMAEADGKLTGRPGIAFVTRAPGATNAAAGVHVAFQDSTPMILFVGQVGADTKGREAFQEVDLPAMFAPLAKWTAEIDDPARIPEFVSRAFHVARAGRPGPVVLSLPETMLSAAADARDAPAAAPALAAPSIEAVAQAVAALKLAERPLLIVGGPGWSARAKAKLEAFARKSDIPVAVSLRCQDYISSAAPQAVGDMGVAIAPDLARTVREADVVLVIGARLGEMTTQGYTLFNLPVPRQKLIHVYPDGNEIGRVYRPALGIVSASEPFLEALASAWTGGAGPWTDWRRIARESYEAWTVPVPTPGDVRLEEVVTHLARRLPDDAVITNGAGNYAGWVHRYYRFRGWRTQLAPTSGSMGYGLPAAVAAKLRHPGRIVVAFAGDGCFQMTCQEFGTAVQHGAAPVVVVADNGSYGTIRMHQARHYPGRVCGTRLVNPDFAAFARAYGGFGATVRDGGEFADAFEEAVASKLPAILHLHTDPDALTTGKRLVEVERHVALAAG